MAKQIELSLITLPFPLKTKIYPSSLAIYFQYFLDNFFNVRTYLNTFKNNWEIYNPNGKRNLTSSSDKFKRNNSLLLKLIFILEISSYPKSNHFKVCIFSIDASKNNKILSTKSRLSTCPNSPNQPKPLR
jgi:hypothetical protein